MVEYPHGTVRAATHHDVTAADIATILRAASEVLHEMAGRPVVPVGVRH